MTWGSNAVGIRASRRTKALEVALWTPTGSFPRSQVSRVLADAAHPTSIVRVMSKGEKKARRVSKVEMLAGEGSWTENIADVRCACLPRLFSRSTPRVPRF